MGRNELTIEDKNKIERLYTAGVNSVDISKRLGKNCKKETIKKHIQRNLKHLNKIHEVANSRDSVILKQTQFESSREMGNKSFVKENGSIYKQSKNGDLVINKKVAPIISFDTPKRFTKKEYLGF